MISRLEVFRYRCFNRLDIELGNYHVLAGANGSGKSTLLDIPLLLGDMIRHGLMAAFLEAPTLYGGARAESLSELVHHHRGDYFAFAIEMDLPDESIRRLLEYRTGTILQDETRWPSSVRYELRLQIFNQIELNVIDEFLYIMPANSKRPDVGWGIGGDRPDDWFTVIERTTGQVGTTVRLEYQGRRKPFELRLAPTQLALANVPQDLHLFPASVWLRQQLEQRMIAYQPNVESLRQAVAAGQPRMIRDNAANLPWLILQLQQQNKMLFEAWVEHVKLALPNLTMIEAQEREEDRHAYLKLTYNGGYTVTSSGLSDGTLRILAMTILPYLRQAPAVICLEEPENGIHPRGIEIVLQSLSSMYDSQVWLSTHSPVVLAHSDLESVLVMQNQPDGSVAAVRGDQHPNLKNWQGGIDLGSLFAAGVLG